MEVATLEGIVANRLAPSLPRTHLIGAERTDGDKFSPYLGHLEGDDKGTKVGNH